MLETPLRQKIIKKLRAKGGFWYHAHGDPMSQKGIPDIIGCYHGLFFAFEVKRPGAGIATELQAYTLKQIIKAGGEALVIRSFEEAEAVLDRVIGAQSGKD